MPAYHNLTDDTIAAIATPSGIGALGILRVSGAKALPIADAIFKLPNSKKNVELSALPSHTVHFGLLMSANGQILDEALATIFKAPHSYTGHDTVEFSCHGSPYILRQALAAILQQGARLAEPGEFTLRAFINGKRNLAQAEAVADLIAAESEGAHAVAMQQMRGGFALQLQAMRQSLIHFASLIELELDFAEEDVTFADRTQLKQLVTDLQQNIENLRSSFSLGNALKNGVNTVIAGRPNAGKSTLLNALLNEERALVSDIPGTTRDTIEEVLHINGVSFRLIDTAGIRQATDAIEVMGVQKTYQKIEQAAVLIYLFDAVLTTPAQVKDDLMQLLLPQSVSGLKCLVVANKLDAWQKQYPQNAAIDPLKYLPQTSNTNLNAEKTVEYVFLQISALNHQGLGQLRQTLYNLVLENQSLNNASQMVISNARHYEALLRASQALNEVQSGIKAKLTTDLLAHHLRDALYHLGSITGSEIVPDDILGSIFSKFCIGK